MTFRRCSAVAAVFLFLLASGQEASARKVKVKPKTSHASLTQRTDGSFGYQVLPGKPMRLDLVGPGDMKITVRLNNESKRSVFKGRLEIKRSNKIIKRANLKLHRSRVGRYRENTSIFPSLPKAFKVKVPGGVQSYTFSLRAARGISMTVGIDYRSNADQSKAAAAEEDPLALVPLVPPDAVADSGDSGDIPLVPLAPAATTEKKKPAEEKKPVVVARKEETAPAKKPVTKVAAVDKPRPVKKIVLPKPVKTATPEEKKTASSKVITIPAAKEPTSVTKPAPTPSKAIMSVGLKAGQISPLQKISGTTYTGSLDVRVILPVFDERLTIGVEGGYYPYALTLTGKRDQEINISVIPVSLQLFYRLPLGGLIEPFLGLGADVFIWSGESKVHSSGAEIESGSGIGFGGHVSAGLEAEMGPGFLLAEVRAGISFAFLEDVVGWGSTINMSGLSTVLGYRFVF